MLHFLPSYKYLSLECFFFLTQVSHSIVKHQKWSSKMASKELWWPFMWTIATISCLLDTNLNIRCFLKNILVKSVGQLYELYLFIFEKTEALLLKINQPVDLGIKLKTFKLVSLLFFCSTTLHKSISYYKEMVKNVKRLFWSCLYESNNMFVLFKNKALYLTTGFFFLWIPMILFYKWLLLPLVVVVLFLKFSKSPFI